MPSIKPLTSCSNKSYLSSPVTLPKQIINNDGYYKFIGFYTICGPYWMSRKITLNIQHHKTYLPPPGTKQTVAAFCCSNPFLFLPNT